MRKNNLKTLLSLIFFIQFFASGCAQVYSNNLAVMRSPIEVAKGLETYQEKGFGLLVEGENIFVVSGNEDGISLYSMRQDGERFEQKTLLKSEKSLWSIPEETAKTLCGGEEIFEKETEIFVDKNGIVRHNDGFLVAFSAKITLECGGENKNNFDFANFFLISFDRTWNPAGGPWKAWSAVHPLSAIAVSWEGKAGIFILSEEYFTFVKAPQDFKGKGETHSYSIKMKNPPAWGRNPSLFALETEGKIYLVAAYMEKSASGNEGKEENSIVVQFLEFPDGKELITNKIKTPNTPTATNLTSSPENSIFLLWSLIGYLPPAGKFVSIMKANIGKNGDIERIETIFEKREISGASILINKLSSCFSKKGGAVAWVMDMEGMDGMEQRIWLKTLTNKKKEDKIFEYRIKPGQRGIKNIHISPSGNQFVIIWEEKSLYEIRTALSSI